MVDHKLPQLKRLAFVTWIYPVNSKLFHLCDITLDVWMRYCHTRPNLDDPWAQVRVFSATLLIEQGWNQLIGLCPPAIPPSD
jgi:hypothetical protein